MQSTTSSHHHHHHTEEHFEQSATVRDIVIGMADGLTVPFALAAGLSTAVSTNGIIVTAGFAEIVAGSIAMGLGGYLAGKTEIEHYDAELKREYSELTTHYDTERREVKEIFAGYGLSPESQELIMCEMEKDHDKWVDFMMRFELGLEKPDINRARMSARNIGVAYIVGGTVPLMAYIFTETPNEGLIYSSIITVVCLMFFGYFKSKATGQDPVKGGFRTTMIGVLAAAAAYFFAHLFTNL
ncbi:MAG TPA: VIT1/CCC1 transporter family protein [Bacteroidia bacterium]|nr:VIT1/CCC1 transporter family protein [Bacteroidota bacterium]MBP9791389.1 VIT1/CCC1 transporter family protein [Bacteroidia bacterium]MBK7431714.1 VIT1/CCC1 transporter family protein [Bacteroidota bacterium]MBK7570807.1 VIT1/CCC1 transporter family protein [Bacteroidota bacterium]MBP9922861.1 VIT1/CCC1 transporter family protein [Bacteroidia bacterium]